MAKQQNFLIAVKMVLRIYIQQSCCMLSKFHKLYILLRVKVGNLLY